MLKCLLKNVLTELEPKIVFKHQSFIFQNFIWKLMNEFMIEAHYILKALRRIRMSLCVDTLQFSVSSHVSKYISSKLKLVYRIT